MVPGPPHPCRSLSGYVDGRLTAWRRAVVERHLAGCTRCALEVAQIRALRRFLASPAAPETPPGLQDRLLGIARGTDDRTDDRIDDCTGDRADLRPRAVPPHRATAGGPGDERPGDRPRPLVGAVGVMAACLLVLGAAGAGALVTGMTTPAPGAAPRASLTTVLPRLLSWPGDPGGAETVRPVDNGDRP